MAAPVQIVGLRELERDLARLSPEIRKELNKEFGILADEIAGDARTNASWSSRIRGAISKSVGTSGAAIVVNRGRAPHAGLYERGGRGGVNPFRHPLFGNRDYWYNQRTRPFIQPAIDEHAADVERRAQAAVDDAARKANWF